MAYEVEKGRIVTDDNPDTDPDALLPKTATDLRFPEFPLAYRESQLDQVRQLVNKVIGWELKFILVANDANYEDVSRIVDAIATRSRFSKITVPCENEKCPGGPKQKIPVYENYCGLCSKVDPRTNGVQKRLCVLRNVRNRLTFLESQISSSLANVLSREQLTQALEEIQKWQSVLSISV